MVILGILALVGMFLSVPFLAFCLRNVEDETTTPPRPDWTGDRPHWATL